VHAVPDLLKEGFGVYAEAVEDGGMVVGDGAGFVAADGASAPVE